jgi:hypothetical protein
MEGFMLFRFLLGIFAIAIVLLHGMAYAQPRPTVPRTVLHPQFTTTNSIRNPRTNSTIQNGSFESGLTGWTVVNGNGVTGNITSATSDFINLGVDSLGGCVSQDTTDYTQFSGGGSRPASDDTSINSTYTGSVSIVTSVAGLAPADGTKAVYMELGSDTRTMPYHVLHGPAIVSDLFSADAGNVVNLQWYSSAGGDDFAVLGYLLDTTTCTQYEVVDETGYSVNGWQFVSMTIPATSSAYRFVFVNGTHDASGGQYSGASFWVDDISVGKPQIIFFDASESVANYYTGAITPPFTLNGSAKSFLTVSYRSLTPSTCTVSGSTVTIVGVGVCTITASQGGGVDGNGVSWASAPPVTSSFTITNYRPQTITFGALAHKIRTAAAFSVSASASSGLSVTFSSSTPAICTINGSTVTLTGTIGDCTITANQAGGSASGNTYIAAPAVANTFHVVNPNIITFPAIPAKTESDASFSVTATATSALAVTYTTTTSAVCTVSGSTVTIVGPGDCSIAADQAGGTNSNGVLYIAASTVTNTFRVKTNQTINFAALSDKTLIDPNFSLTATATSNLAVSFSSATPSICTVTSGLVQMIGSGTCTLVADQIGNAVYASAPSVSQSFTVKQIQTINFPMISDKNEDSKKFNLEATTSSGLVILYTSTTPSICTVAGRTVTILGAGVCTINAAQAGGVKSGVVYAPATDVTRSIIIKGNQTITFGALSDIPYTSADFDPGASASSTLPVIYTTNTPAVCTIVSNNVHIVAPGTCSVTATQSGGMAGPLTYDAAVSITRVFEAQKIQQSITFPVISDRTIYSGGFVLSATASSGLPVTYTSNSLMFCTISGLRVTIVRGGGFCTIVASQNGGTLNSVIYDAAPSIMREFVISDATRTPTASKTRTPTPTAALSDLKKAAIGNAYVLALLQDNTLISWGKNDRGINQSTVPSALRDNVFRDVAASIGTAYALDMDGNVYAWGENLYGERDVPVAAQTGVKAIAAGSRFAFAILSDDTVVAWGRNEFGQSSVPVGLTDVIEVDGGDRHAVALRRDGSVVAWGDNTKGQTKVPLGLIDVIHISAGQDHTLALLNTGRVIGWGSNAKGQLKIPMEAVDIVAIAAGRECSLALKANGVLVTWGDSTYLKFPILNGVSVVAVDAANQNSIIGVRGGGVLIAGIRNVHDLYTSPTATHTPLITLTASLTPTPSETPTMTVSKTPSMTRSATFTRTHTRSRTPSFTRSSTRTLTPSRTMSPTRTP